MLFRSQMPAMNGFDLLRLLRASNVGQSREIPVIAVTARSEMSLAEFMEAGFAGCLHKPFTMKELLAVVQVASTSTIEPLENEAPESSPSPIYNFDALLAYTDGDAELTHTIISTFIEETTKEIHLVEGALHQRDIRVVAARAHKLLPIYTMLWHSHTLSLLTDLELCKELSFMEEANLQKTNLLVLALKESVVAAQGYLVSLQ